MDPASDAADGTPRGYLDAVSAEPLHPAARETLLAALDQGWADHRRLHREARTARLLLDNARAVVAEALDVRADEVGLVGSGTRAVHDALLGLVRARPRAGLVARSAVERSAVLHAAHWAAATWGTREQAPTVPVDAHGRVDVTALEAAVRVDGTAAVALQAANHEVGTTQPVDEVDLPDDVPLACDLSVVAGRGPLPRAWTTASADARLWGGPAGVGVVVVRRGARWLPPFPGDHEGLDGPDGASVPAALAAAAALQSLVAEAADLSARHRAWVDRVRAAAAALPDTEVVGDPVDRAPHLVTFSCLYAPGEELVRALDRRGLAVASGSACTSSTLEPSHVLAAMGALTHGNVRVSLSRATTEDDVDRLCAALPDAVAEARASVR